MRPSAGTAPPQMGQILKSGLGAGKRDYDRPSLLRATLIESAQTTNGDEVVELSTNIDDSSAEILGFTLERLYEKGALEAWFSPVFMKKNRPAYILTVLCSADRQEALENVIFANTTTIGIRAKTVARRTLKREKRTVQTQYGPIEVKACEVPDEEGRYKTRFYPEYESAKQLAQTTGLDLATLYRAAKDAVNND